MVLLRTICAYDCCRDKDLFCQQHGLRAKGIAEIRKLRQQLTNIGRYMLCFYFPTAVTHSTVIATPCI